MTPSIGIMASSITGNLGTFESIATATASGGETYLSFTSIPGNYKSLQIRGIGRAQNLNTGAINLRFNFNSDFTSANYAVHTLRANGTAVSATGGVSSGFISSYFAVTNGSDISNAFGVSIIDIIDYVDTSKNKTVKMFSGTDANSTSTSWYVNQSSGLWLSNSAITSIDFYLGGTSLFAAGSTYALYGIKG